MIRTLHAGTTAVHALRLVDDWEHECLIAVAHTRSASLQEAARVFRENHHPTGLGQIPQAGLPSVVDPRIASMLLARDIRLALRGALRFLPLSVSNPGVISRSYADPVERRSDEEGLSAAKKALAALAGD